MLKNGLVGNFVQLLRHGSYKKRTAFFRQKTPIIKLILQTISNKKIEKKAYEIIAKKGSQIKASIRFKLRLLSRSH